MSKCEHGLTTNECYVCSSPKYVERQQALDKKAENARELGLDYEPVPWIENMTIDNTNELSKPTAPAQDELAYRQAVSLATWIFKKHFAHEEHYASGRVVWEPCDTTAGVISQIDDMVCGLVQPAATVKESLTVQPAAPVQEPVAWMYEVNGAHTILDLFEPPDDAYDEGTLYPLYTTPQPMREWVSLTVDEIWEVYKKHGSLEYKAFARAIEQSLKEKNT